eukprot:5308381-Prymnesium_polylepis.1
MAIAEAYRKSGSVHLASFDPCRGLLRFARLSCLAGCEYAGSDPATAFCVDTATTTGTLAVLCTGALLLVTALVT